MHRVFLAIGLGTGVVEMTNLPVLFNQTGFSFWYWVIVAAVVFTSYHWVRQIFSKIGSKKALAEKALRLG